MVKESSKAEFEKVSPDQIESINVLKNEYAIQKYGATAKNGVIEVTTKKDLGFTNQQTSFNISMTNKMIKNSASGLSINSPSFRVTDFTYDINNKRLSGKVMRGSFGLPGVNISVNNSGKVLVSDFNGNFEIAANLGDAVDFQYLDKRLVTEVTHSM